MLLILSVTKHHHQTVYAAKQLSSQQNLFYFEIVTGSCDLLQLHASEDSVISAIYTYFIRIYIYMSMIQAMITLKRGLKKQQQLDLYSEAENVYLLIRESLSGVCGVASFYRTA